MRATFISLALVVSNCLAQPTLYEQLIETVVPPQAVQEWAEKKVAEHKPFVLRQDIDQKLHPFHKRLAPISQGETFCQVCHSPWPHARTLRKRSFLNMHTRFISCATCHFRPQQPLAYAWLNYRTWHAAQLKQPFRIGKDFDNEQPIKGELKIAPWFQNMPVIPKQDSPLGQEVRRIWQTGDLTARVELVAKIHTPLDREGPKCGLCHSKDGILDLVALGAEPEQVNLIRNHVIPNAIDRLQESETIRIVDLLK